LQAAPALTLAESQMKQSEAAAHVAPPPVLHEQRGARSPWTLQTGSAEAPTHSPFST
jgi:hypothetical protein